MREISPAKNLSADEFLKHMSGRAQRVAAEIRRAKQAGTRPLPSIKLIDSSALLSAEFRRALLDKAASLVDENLFGRAEMCSQFAGLLTLGLRHLGLDAREVIGTATYFPDGQRVFSWEHAWVRVGGEVIDGNTDILYENPTVPAAVSSSLKPYWGPVDLVPPDRKLTENHGARFPEDEDVDRIWWPDLAEWIGENHGLLSSSEGAS